MRGVCAFCGVHRQLSKEHVLGRWMRKHFVSWEGGSTKTTTHVRPGGKRTSRTDRNQIPMSTTVVRLVCKSCNEQWMAKIEEDAKPHLIQMNTAPGGFISSACQLALSRWAYKTAVVVDLMSDMQTTTPERRRQMVRASEPPGDVVVGLARFEDPSGEFIHRNNMRSFATTTVTVGTVSLQVYLRTSWALTDDWHRSPADAMAFFDANPMAARLYPLQLLPAVPPLSPFSSVDYSWWKTLGRSGDVEL